METFNVRPTVNADLSELMGMDHSSITDHVWQLEMRQDPRVEEITALFREVRLPRPVRLSYPNDPFALADEWKQKAMMWTAVDRENAIGYLTVVEPRTGAAWINDLAVTPTWRRKGVATALLSSAYSWCAERSNQRLFLEVQSKNHPAIAFAQENAFEFCGYNDRYYSNNDVMLVFVRAV